MHPSRVWLELYFCVQANVELLVFKRPEVWSGLLPRDQPNWAVACWVLDHRHGVRPFLKFVFILIFLQSSRTGPRIRAKSQDRASIEPRADRHLVVGFIAGWLAGKVVRGNGFGLVGDAAIGIVGALIGDWLLHRLGIHFGSGIIGLIMKATIGAIVLLLALRLTGASGWGGR
jgi:uncharacterized membrane protein YeaQ/YmgE (transglycosylase-associated protein family)